MIELADTFTPVALLLLLAVGIVALGLLFANPSRLRTASLAAISLVLAGEVWWIAFYAQGVDGYFLDGRTGWDFAVNNDHRQWVVTAVAVASARPFRRARWIVRAKSAVPAGDPNRPAGHTRQS